MCQGLLCDEGSANDATVMEAILFPESHAWEYLRLGLKDRPQLVTGARARGIDNVGLDGVHHVAR